jgi:hypothetical protein
MRTRSTEVSTSSRARSSKASAGSYLTQACGNPASLNERPARCRQASDMDTLYPAKSRMPRQGARKQKSFCFFFFRKRRLLFFSEEKKQKTFTYVVTTMPPCPSAREIARMRCASRNGLVSKTLLFVVVKGPFPLMNT